MELMGAHRRRVAMAIFMRVDGNWDIVQDNGFRVNIRVNQTENRLSASATQIGHNVQSNSAEGFVNGPNFEMTIDWNNGTKGLYTGTLTSGNFDPPGVGHLKGRTKDLNNPGSEAGWFSERIVVRMA
jgi:hypothetical protein